MPASTTRTARTSTAGRGQTGRPLTRVLAALFDIARSENLRTQSLSTAATQSKIFVEVPAETDVSLWAVALRVPIRRVQQRQEPDIGIVLTTVAGEIGGWTVEVQHVHRIPTIEGAGTPQ